MPEPGLLSEVSGTPGPAQPTVKVKKRPFFATTDDEDDDAASEPKSAPQNALDLNSSPLQPVAGPSRPKLSAHIKAEDSDEEIMLVDAKGDKVIKRKRSDIWKYRYLGDFIAEGWATASASSMIKLKNGDKVDFERWKPSAAQQKAAMAGRKGGAAPKVKDGTLVRFRNHTGFEVGRLPKAVASWVAALLGHDLVLLRGTVLECSKNFTTGSTILVSIRVEIARSAFAAIAPAAVAVEPSSPPSTKRRRRSSSDSSSSSIVSIPAKEFKGKDKPPKQSKATSSTGKVGERGKMNGASQTGGRKTFFDNLKETEQEVKLRERKHSLNRLFDALSLRPVSLAKSKRHLVESFDPDAERKLRKELDANGAKGKGPAKEREKSDIKGEDQAKPSELEDDTERQMDEQQVANVYKKAIKNDMHLPELEPPVTFKLELRPYQRQALAWLTNQEGSDALSTNREKSIHPLFEQYLFPYESLADEEAYFYYNPYEGSLSLEFPEASKRCRGGILADEMGLGKTIMMAALIQTNRVVKTAPPSSSDDSGTDDDSDIGYVPSPVKAQRQRRLNVKGGLHSPKPGSHGVRPHATLVVAPMSLIGQWRDELMRTASLDDLNVLLYYGTNRTSLREELEAGIDVVVTSYGTLSSEFKDFFGDDGKKSKKSTVVEGLFGVEWHRIILDEAHTIRSRTTITAKAVFGLRGRRRCFYRSFVTVPFSNKDPAAIEIVQTILESCLLRREKTMKDGDGNSIIPLPKKTVIFEHLDLGPEERKLYDLIFANAKRTFEGYSLKGTVLNNVTQILAIITRLRQAVLHPLLVLKAIKSGNKNVDATAEAQIANAEIQRLLERYSDGKKVLEARRTSRDCPVCLQPPEIAVKLPCGHIVCRTCTLEYFDRCETEERTTECPECHEPASEAHLAETWQNEKPTSSVKATPEPVEIIDSEDEKDAELERELATVKGQKEREDHLFRPDSDAENDNVGPSNFLAEKDFKSSTKLEALIKHLHRIRKSESVSFTVVFSHFTSFLNLVERVLNRDGFDHVRLDGTMSQKQREAVLRQFNRSKTSLIMVVSTKSGGVGLNLTKANTAIMTDCGWAPASDLQAIDRIHRFGQEKEVTVHRLIIKNSIEDRMLRLQERKINLFKTAVGGDAERVGKLTAEDMHFLFS